MNSDAMKSFLEMGRGVLMERADYEMAHLLENIFDVNTSATAKRKLTLTLELTPDDTRQNIAMRCTAKLTTAPTNPIALMLYAADAEHVYEMTPQIPGQVNFDGEEQESPAQLRLIKIS